MPAYVIVDMNVLEPAAYEEYKKLAQASIAAYGGRYIVRGGATEVLEGSWQPNRLVLLEFFSAERAREWWASKEYDAARTLRSVCARANMVLVDGL